MFDVETDNSLRRNARSREPAARGFSTRDTLRAGPAVCRGRRKEERRRAGCLATRLAPPGDALPSFELGRPQASRGWVICSRVERGPRAAADLRESRISASEPP